MGEGADGAEDGTAVAGGGDGRDGKEDGRRRGRGREEEGVGR